MGKEFVSHLKSQGTVQKLTVHDTPAHNGVAERRNRTILECVQALLHASGLPRFLWGEAAHHVVWLMNRVSTKAVEGKTPHEAVFGVKPNLKDLREWGEKVLIRVEDGNKLGGRVHEGRWIGMDTQSKGARIYWPNKQTVTVERNVNYIPLVTSASRNEGEEDTPSVPQPDAPIPPPPLLEPYPPVPPPAEEVVEAHAKRIRKPSQRVADILEGRAESSPRRSERLLARGIQMPTKEAERVDIPNVEGEQGVGEADLAEQFDGYALSAEISNAEGLEPLTLAEAKRCADWPLWEKAIKEELDLLKNTGTWELTERPPNVNIVGSKWVFQAKKDANRNVIRYKARLVAQGFSQVPGVDYFDTFAPVARLASIHSALAIAADLDMELHQIDIKGAYLNGELTSQERIYMRQAPGYAEPGSPPLVCRLKKTLYGLKQSGRRW